MQVSIIQCTQFDTRKLCLAAETDSGVVSFTDSKVPLVDAMMALATLQDPTTKDLWRHLRRPTARQSIFSMIHVGFVITQLNFRFNQYGINAFHGDGISIIAGTLDCFDRLIRDTNHHTGNAQVMINMIQIILEEKLSLYDAWIDLRKIRGSDGAFILEAK